mgnify:CR=1 FL=1
MMWVSINRRGITRTVILVGAWAIKVPSFRYGKFKWRWRSFLNGLLANLQEVDFAATGWPELCPVVRSSRLGLFVVMPRVRVMTDEEFCEFDYVGFITREDYYARENLRSKEKNFLGREGAISEPAGFLIPAERKADSFGWLDGRIVAIDYGN